MTDDGFRLRISDCGLRIIVGRRLSVVGHPSSVIRRARQMLRSLCKDQFLSLFQWRVDGAAGGKFVAAAAEDLRHRVHVVSFAGAQADSNLLPRNLAEEDPDAASLHRPYVANDSLRIFIGSA